MSRVIPEDLTELGEFVYRSLESLQRVHLPCCIVLLINGGNDNLILICQSLIYPRIQCAIFEQVIDLCHSRGILSSLPSVVKWIFSEVLVIIRGG